MLFRKKPIVIEAKQYIKDHFDTPDGVVHRHDGKAIIQTLEGEMLVSDGDWIITGVKGEKYPCKPDIFEATYEPVDKCGRMV